MPVDASKVADIIAEAAETEIMPRFRKLEAADIREKGPGDLVTIADTAAERFLSAALTALLPGSVVVGEEGVAEDRNRLALLTGPDPVWVIDPIDGTINFASGNPSFAVMVALVLEGQTIMGWIHDPVRHRTATAATGKGTWCGGERLRIAALPAPGEGEDEEGRRRGRGNQRLARRVGTRTALVADTFELRCAGQEYLTLLHGEAQFLLYQRLYPWDHAPGVLLHREAGGFGARLDGSAYTPRETTGGLLLAPDETTWRELRDALILPS